VSQYRFTAARVQWPCSTVTIKPIWSLKWSGQVCGWNYRSGQFERIWAGKELWADRWHLRSIQEWVYHPRGNSSL